MTDGTCSSRRDCRLYPDTYCCNNGQCCSFTEYHAQAQLNCNVDRDCKDFLRPYCCSPYCCSYSDYHDRHSGDIPNYIYIAFGIILAIVFLVVVAILCVKVVTFVRARRLGQATRRQVTEAVVSHPTPIPGNCYDEIEASVQWQTTQSTAEQPPSYQKYADMPPPYSSILRSDIWYWYCGMKLMSDNYLDEKNSRTHLCLVVQRISATSIRVVMTTFHKYFMSKRAFPTT